MHCFGLPSGLPKCLHTNILSIALEWLRTGVSAVTWGDHMSVIIRCVWGLWEVIVLSLSVQGKCAGEWYLSFYWVWGRWWGGVCLYLAMNRHLHAHLNCLINPNNQHTNLSSLTHPHAWASGGAYVYIHSHLHTSGADTGNHKQLPVEAI
jgi:hypothetical protein